MPSRRRPSQVLRAVTVLTLTGAVAGIPAVRADAEPRRSTAAPQTCEESRRQFLANGEAAERVAEQVNDARVARVKIQRAYVTAAKKARVVKAQYGALAGEMKKLVAGELKSAPAGQVAVFFTSRSPKDFADQMSLIDYVARRKGAKIDAIGRVRDAAVTAQGAAQTALNARLRVERDIEAKAVDLKSHGIMLGRLQARLCPNESMTMGERGSRSDAVRTPVVIGGAPSSAARKAVATALAQLGDPYCWGCAGPSSFDCSGLTSFAWAAAGVRLPHSSRAQAGMGTQVSRAQVQAGDIVYFYPGNIHHVGIAINNLQMVHAPTFGQPVQVASIDASPYAGATRIG